MEPITRFNEHPYPPLECQSNFSTQCEELTYSQNLRSAVTTPNFTESKDLRFNLDSSALYSKLNEACYGPDPALEYQIIEDDQSVGNLTESQMLKQSRPQKVYGVFSETDVNKFAHKFIKLSKGKTVPSVVEDLYLNWKELAPNLSNKTVNHLVEDIFSSLGSKVSFKSAQAAKVAI